MDAAILNPAASALEGKLQVAEGDDFGPLTSFDSGLSKREQRRSSRYAEMGITVARDVMRSQSPDQDEWKTTGTIFTTGFGALESTTRFGEGIAANELDMLSPLDFANSVSNSCVGQVCLALDVHGPSTMLFGGNPLAYAIAMIKAGKASQALAGAVEEWNADAFGAFAARFTGSRFAEGAAALRVSEGSGECALCRVLDTGTTGLAGSPLASEQLDEPMMHTAVGHVRDRISTMAQPDAWLSSSRATPLAEVEDSEFEGIVRGDTTTLFGETIGAAFTLAVAAGSLGFGSETVRGHLGFSNPYNRLLVTGHDLAGNYLFALLRAEEQDNKRDDDE